MKARLKILFEETKQFGVGERTARIWVRAREWYTVNGEVDDSLVEHRAEWMHDEPIVVGSCSTLFGTRIEVDEIYDSGKQFVEFPNDAIRVAIQLLDKLADRMAGGE